MKRGFFMASASQLQGRIVKLQARIQARQQELADLLRQCREVRNQLAEATKAAKQHTKGKAGGKVAGKARGKAKAPPRAARAKPVAAIVDREAEE
jgi:TolA-binding protein